MTLPANQLPRSGRVLALDWGARRIGVAISDSIQLIATPLTTLLRRAGKRLPLGAFLTLVERETPVALLVGLALDDHGKLGESAQAAQQMGLLFAQRSGLPLAFTDESFSTQTAADLLSQTHPRLPRSRQLRSDTIDAAAAAVLLQQWLDSRRSCPE